MPSLSDKSTYGSCGTELFLKGLWGSNIKCEDIKEHGIALLLLVVCFYKISKLSFLRKLWRKTKTWLPFGMKDSPPIDKRIETLTTDLRMEMRELSEKIVEFKKWSKIELESTAKENGKMCQNCELRLTSSKGYKFIPTHNISKDGNWVQYLHRYVYNPHPRILDTTELENMKRAY